jgi:CubicO group peptidase (beta-lactamase class C family)
MKEQLINPASVEEARKFLESSNSSSGAPFSAFVYGNAFTDEEIFVGVGIGNSKVNKPVDKDMYWRWASMTKLLGNIILTAALEDSIIESLDDPIYKYIPEFSTINSWVQDAKREPGTDKYGTPNYSMVLGFEEGLGKKITVRDILKSTTGLGYAFWGTGSRRNIVNAFSNVPSDQRYIAWLQYLESLYPDGQGFTDITPYYNLKLSKKTYTITELILERLKYPLLCYPGSDYYYGMEHEITGGIISGGLLRKGIVKTSAEYCKERIFEPLGMKNTWLGCGSLNPPSDYDEKVTNAFFVRANDIDGQAGPLVQLNTLYRDSQLEAQGDGFVFLSRDPFTKTHEPTDIYAGGYSSVGIGTLTDFCKLMKLIINNGVVHKKSCFCNITEVRVLSPQSIQFLINPKNDKISGIWNLGRDTQNLLGPNDVWMGGGAVTDKYNAPVLPFAIGEGTFRWAGFFQTSFYFDINTGNYLVSGTQAAGVSWLLPTSTSSFQPSTLKLWQILTK